MKTKKQFYMPVRIFLKNHETFMKTYMDIIFFSRFLVYKSQSQIQLWFYWIRDTFFYKFKQGLFWWVFFLYTMIWVIVSSNLLSYYLCVSFDKINRNCLQ